MLIFIYFLCLTACWKIGTVLNQKLLKHTRKEMINYPLFEQTNVYFVTKVTTFNPNKKENLLQMKMFENYLGIKKVWLK